MGEQLVNGPGQRRAKRFLVGLAMATGVVVVTSTGPVGVGGGGAETTCDSGSEAQPPKMPRMPQQAMTGASCLTARAEAEGDRRVRIVFFIA